MGLLILVIAYVVWHAIFRKDESGINTVDNLAITISDDNARQPFLWLKEHTVTDHGKVLSVERKEECFSVLELTAIFSPDKEIKVLDELCDITLESHDKGYTIAGNCRKGSAQFLVDVAFRTINGKHYEWQQTISDIHNKELRKENVIFKQRGACHVPH